MQVWEKNGNSSEKMIVLILCDEIMKSKTCISLNYFDSNISKLIMFKS